MLLGLLLSLNIMICLALIGVVLLQRSEGGALGSGSPTGLITTRGAGDLLTRTTWVLFTLFLTISLALTLLGGRERSSQSILNRLKSQSINPDAAPAAATAAPSAAPGSAAPGPLLAPARPASAPSEFPAPSPAALSAPVPTVRVPTAARPERSRASRPVSPPAAVATTLAPTAPATPPVSTKPASGDSTGNSAPQ